MIVFDDLHWADSESVALFERLAEPGSGPRLLVGTYRPDALIRRHPIAESAAAARAPARRHPRPARPAVGRPTSGRSWPRSTGARRRTAWSRRCTAGPAATRSSSRSCSPRRARTTRTSYATSRCRGASASSCAAQLGDLDDRAAAWSRPPPCSAAGSRSTCWPRCRATTEDELIPILRHLVSRGLLVETGADVFSFRHALAREAIEADLLGRERRRLHQAALDALRGRAATTTPAPSPTTPTGRDGSTRWSRRRARARATHWTRARRTRHCSWPSSAWARPATTRICSGSRAAPRGWPASLPDALGHAERRLEAARRAGDLEAESAALRLVCRLHYDLGDKDATDANSHRLAALVEQLDDGPERGKAMAILAQMRMLHDDLEGATSWADQAIELADRLDLPHIRVRAQIEKASAFVNAPAMVDEGVALLGEAIEEAAAQGQWVIVARGLNNLVRGDYYRPDADEARALLVRMREANERAGFDLFAGSYWDGLADLAEWEGDLGAALTHVDEAIRANRHRQQNDKTPWYRAHAAGLALEAGEVDRAEAIFTELDPATGARAQWWCGLGLHIAARRGDLDSAQFYARALTRAATERGGTEPQLVHDVVRAMLLGGVPIEEVKALFDELPTGWVRPAPKVEPYRLLAEAQLREASGDPEGALHGYEAAIREAGTEVRPAALGTAHVGAGRTLVALGQARRGQGARGDRRCAAWTAGEARGSKSSLRSSAASAEGTRWRDRPS